MTSDVDQAWADMKSPKAEKYASRVKQILSGSVQGRTTAKKALGSSAPLFNQVRATCRDEPTAEAGAPERVIFTGTS